MPKSSCVRIAGNEIACDRTATMGWQSVADVGIFSSPHPTNSFLSLTNCSPTSRTPMLNDYLNDLSPPCHQTGAPLLKTACIAEHFGAEMNFSHTTITE